MQPELPTGTVTFLFTDVEGSTRLLDELGESAYADALEEHRGIIRTACGAHGGVEVDTQGDAFFFAFPTAPGALAAASDFTRDLATNGPIRVRAGVHTGTPHPGNEGYVGHDVHRAARIAAAGDGGQVLVSMSTAQLVDVDLIELGEHRFKDLAAPERVFQLGGDEFPALKSLYRTNLPIPATPFLGRLREVEEVVALLRRPEARLLTLVGPGGAGKTRLGLQAAAEVSEGFPDGVFWAPLAPLRDEAAVPTALAQALDVPEQPGAPMSDSIVSTLTDKRLLLVVDNCEHLVDAVAALLRKLLDGCPNLAVVASSRERLGLRAERVYDVPPMATADAEALFLERATAASADFHSDEHVTAICDAVDGLPLAIELAAARVRSLSPESIRSRLDERLVLLTSRARDVEERQRTLEATIAWSYDLLSDEEQSVLRSLSVFAGGCTLAGAEAVAGADLDLLESLLDKSLLRHRVDEAGQDRYWLLETIREYAARELALAGELEDVQVRHTSFYLDLAAELSPHVARPVSDEQLDRVRSDRENFRIAHARALANEDGATAIRLVRCLARILFRLEPYADSYSTARASLALPGGAVDDRAYALVRLSSLASTLGETDSPREMLSQAEALFEQLGDRLGLADATAWRSAVAALEGEYDTAIALAEKQAQLATALDDPDLASYADQLLGDALMFLAAERDDRVAAERSRLLHEARLRGSSRYESAFEELSALVNLALCLFVLGEYSESIALGQRSLRRALDVGIERAQPQLMVIGVATAAGGEHRVGVVLVSFSVGQFRDEGVALARFEDALLERFERGAREALGDAEYEDAVRAGEELSNDEAIELALGVSANEPSGGSE